MATFTKSDLKFDHYTWTAKPSDNPNLTGAPDSSLFNRQQGYEVIYMMNKVLTDIGSNLKSKLHQGEDLIKKDLPGSTRSQKDVFDWLKKKLS